MTGAVQISDLEIRPLAELHRTGARMLSHAEWFVHAWAHIISLWPGRGPRDTMPRVDVIERKRNTGPGEWLGRYWPTGHLIHVIHTGCERETLHTVVHELAHAWAPHERAHHGKAWQTTYAALIAWLFGVEMTVAKAREHAEQEPTMITRYGTGHRLTAAALDIAAYAAILRGRPNVSIVGAELVARLEPDITHRIRIKD